MRWTDEETRILLENYDKPWSELKLLLPNRTKIAIKNKIENLGLKRNRFKKIKKKRFTEFEKGWLAALIDGEGSLGLLISKPNKYHETDLMIPRIDISNTCKALIDKVCEVTGIFQIYKGNRGNSCKPVWVWRCSSVLGILNILNAVKPYLIVKRKQAELLIEFCNLRLKNEKYTEREYEIVKLLKKLNEKGVEYIV